jgi:hypothetical protein
MIYTVSASDLLILEDAVLPKIKAETLEDAISFADGVFSNFPYSAISELLRFTDRADAQVTLNLTASDTLSFTEVTHPRTLVETINDFLFMWDVVDSDPFSGVIREQLVLTETLLIYQSRLLNPDVLTFTDALVLQYLPSKTLNDSVALSDSSSCVLINRQAPSTTVGYIPPTVELNVSFVDGLETISVHCPDFNDSESITYKRLNLTSRGYTPIITGIAGWLPKRARKMTFTYLLESETIRIRRFWRRNAGKPVSLHDIYGDVRTVILQNPEFEIAQVGRENRSLTLDLYVL